MISPLEIQEKEFSRSLKGFKEEEVNEFLDRITLDLERLLEENRQLKAEKKQMKEDLEKYQTSETAVLETLETAKALMGDISVSAEKRAQILIKNAEMEAEQIQREARESAERMKEESRMLHSSLIGIRSRYKQLLESEMERLDTLGTDLLSEQNIKDIKDLPETKRTSKQTAETPAKKQQKSLNREDMKKTMVHIK